MRGDIASSRQRAGRGAWELAENQTLRFIPGPRGVLIRVSSGCIVVTQEGDQEDYVVRAGQDLRMTGADLVVAWAVSPSSFVVSDTAA